MTVLSPPAPTSVSPSGEVWDRLWRTRPSDAKDDALLKRELAGPRWHALTTRIKSTFGSLAGLRTIELGSGRGDISALLAQRGADVTLLDRSPVALGEASQRFDRLGMHAEFEQADMLGTLSGLRGQYDVVISLGVVEHFIAHERTHAIRSHLDVLRPGGMALVSVPHACCLPYRLWKSYLEARGWWPYGFERPFSKPELARRARKAGFSRCELECFGFWQSVGGHLVKPICRLDVDWAHKRSTIDRIMGLNLLLFGWRGDDNLPGESR